MLIVGALQRTVLALGVSTAIIVPNTFAACKTIHMHNPVIIFTHHVKSMFAAALGIEILCITAAEIGENSGLYFFGYHLVGIAFAYTMGFALVWVYYVYDNSW